MISLFKKNFLGIDIGTNAIKVVELSKSGKKIKLENYGEISTEVLYGAPFRTLEKGVLQFEAESISQALKIVFQEMKVKAKKASFSIPDFVSFFTTFILPPMSKEEIPQAVVNEARKYVPAPVSELFLDWQSIDLKKIDHQTGYQILLAAVPLKIIEQYRQISAKLDLELVSLEAEVFSLIRALVSEEKGVVGLVDSGAKTTTCSIVENGILKISHSFDHSGEGLTKKIAEALSLDYETAEKLKRKYGLTFGPDLVGKKIGEILKEEVDLIIKEIERVFKKFYLEEGKDVEKVIFVGGMALLPGLLNYLEENVKKKVEIGQPFKNVSYPEILRKKIEKIGPAYAVAVGLALSGFKK